ncbi:Abi-alpha family protein [Hymenobacter cheonanensis]|uniref:Abi-alpha family protein n=1 Tax=Hymenobacter sp. CA2-7 TaxID=3063993 RepID=UPI0027128D1E|nr:Abi-alpha family protein [Hymenobacter sp. CA2-7]MDO7888181.1 Abi-alpha family protein [Hymenobacter sp. CA2-7]
MPDPLTTLAVATGGAFLGKFVGPAAEAIGKAAWEQAQQLGARATAHLAAVGREPQPVEPKLLLPLVQAASLESDPTLAEKWAALLANAADPAQRVAVQPGFAEVLRQLSADDASLLTKIYAEYEWSDEQPPRLFDVDYLSSQLKWDATQLNLSLDNLLRLRLVDALVTAVFGPAPTLRGNTALGITVYGEQFLKAVTPPTS